MCIVLDTGIQEFPDFDPCSKGGFVQRRLNYSWAVNSQDQRVSTLPPWRIIDAKELKHLFESKTHKYGGYLRQSWVENSDTADLTYSLSTPNSRSKREAQHSSITIPISRAWYWSQHAVILISTLRMLKLGKKGGFSIKPLKWQHTATDVVSA